MAFRGTLDTATAHQLTHLGLGFSARHARNTPGCQQKTVALRAVVPNPKVHCREQRRSPSRPQLRFTPRPLWLRNDFTAVLTQTLSTSDVYEQLPARGSVLCAVGAEGK